MGSKANILSLSLSLSIIMLSGCQQIALTKHPGVDIDTLNKVDTAVTNNTYPNIHSLLVSKDGKLVYEKYWPGKDERWGDDRGVMIHASDSLHDIRSISKSIVSACIGIAVQQGKIKSVQQKVFEYFPEHIKYDTGLKSQLTIEHLLSMSSGIKWNEEVPYDNPENSEIRMMSSPDPIEYVLSQPMDFPPGQHWKYNGGTTQLLAAIILKATGKRADDFANEFLFKPLGITKYEWIKYPGTGTIAAASGLRLRSRDLLKFGLLYLNEGSSGSTQIVSPEWVKQSTQPHVKIGGFADYGYQFWLFQDSVFGKRQQFAVCVGNGDQRIFIDKERKMVTVVTAGNYNKWNIKNESSSLVRNFVYPALKEKK